MIAAGVIGLFLSEVSKWKPSTFTAIIALRSIQKSEKPVGGIVIKDGKILLSYEVNTDQSRTANISPI